MASLGDRSLPHQQPLLTLMLARRKSSVAKSSWFARLTSDLSRAVPASAATRKKMSKLPWPAADQAAAFHGDRQSARDAREKAHRVPKKCTDYRLGAFRKGRNCGRLTVCLAPRLGPCRRNCGCSGGACACTGPDGAAMGRLRSCPIVKEAHSRNSPGVAISAHDGGDRAADPGTMEHPR